MWTIRSYYKEINDYTLGLTATLRNHLKKMKQKISKTGSIEVIKIRQDTFILMQMKRFGSAGKHKEMLQLAAASSFIDKAKITKFTTVPK